MVIYNVLYMKFSVKTVYTYNPWEIIHSFYELFLSKGMHKNLSYRYIYVWHIL